MLLSGSRVRIRAACTWIYEAGRTDEYASLLFKARRPQARRDRRAFRLLGGLGVRSLYTERERRSALVALKMLWGPLGRDLGVALDHKAPHINRENAYKAIVRRRDHRAVQVLIDALLDEQVPEAWRCIATLGALGDQRAADAFLCYMAVEVGVGAAVSNPLELDGWPSWTLESGFEVGRALRGLNAPKAFKKVKEALLSPESYQRAAAARIVGGWGDELLAGHVIALLKDPEPLVREMAAHALGDLKAAEALDPLRIALNGDSDAEVRSAAERALDQITVEQTQRKRKALTNKKAFYGLPHRADNGPTDTFSKVVSQ